MGGEGFRDARKDFPNLEAKHPGGALGPDPPTQHCQGWGFRTISQEPIVLATVSSITSLFTFFFLILKVYDLRNIFKNPEDT